MKDYMILLTEYLLSSCTCEWSFYIPEDESKEIVNSNAHTHTHTQVCYLKILNMYLTAYLFFCCCLYCHKFNIWNKKGFHSLNLYQSKVTVCLDVFSAKFVTTRRSLYGIHNLHGFFFKSSVVNPHTYIYPYYKRTSKPRSQSIDVEQVFTENAQWYWKKNFKYFYLFGKSPI